ncbi:hypothetical protein CDAR_206601 [Caerostris darwini]|uniref:Uncharacterized protein n=1 Tax=Caerostris darwini TaxID=1538125 RepID=A0AAV4S6G0_9ARAC|nr:hypothetical protein CDAR_206601 [Caerostris darwini]
MSYEEDGPHFFPATPPGRNRTRSAFPFSCPWLPQPPFSDVGREEVTRKWPSDRLDFSRGGRGQVRVPPFFSTGDAHGGIPGQHSPTTLSTGNKKKKAADGDGECG